MPPAAGAADPVSRKRPGDGSSSTARQTRSHHVREPRDDALPLPKLVGVERSVELVIGEGSGAEVVRCIPEESHDGQLTRPYATASVHYMRFELNAAQVERFAAGPVVLRVNHLHYSEATALPDDTKDAMLEDLRPS